MLDIVALLALFFRGEQEEIVVRANEPARPVFVSTDFEVRCRGRRLSLTGISGGGVRFENPAMQFNGRGVALASDLELFLLSERATYRISAACPNTAPAIQIRIYRAQAEPDGSVSYVVRALDIGGNGRIADRGNEPSTAETFWFR